jgi:hypothetical protein
VQWLDFNKGILLLEMHATYIKKPNTFIPAMLQRHYLVPVVVSLDLQSTPLQLQSPLDSKKLADQRGKV